LQKKIVIGSLVLRW